MQTYRIFSLLVVFVCFFRTFELLYNQGEYLSAVRAIRVLRPLRAINRVPSKIFKTSYPALTPRDYYPGLTRPCWSLGLPIRFKNIGRQIDDHDMIFHIFTCTFQKHNTLAAFL